MPDPRDVRGRPLGPREPQIQREPQGGGPRAPHRTRAEERIDEIDISSTKLLADIELLRGELEATTARADEYLAGLQRERAEFSNYRRRTTEEREAMLGLAGEDLIRKVLAIADDFDLAIDNRPAELGASGWVEGVTAIDRKLRALLDSEGVKVVEAEAGRPFDPREHEAIVNVPGTGRAEGEIVEVIRRGYKLRDRVLRPALVAVAAAPDPDAEPAPRTN
ncbi:MAG: nucleotide exchange factor GrpE [Candidatus Limnocylindrales bacterium]